MIKSLRRCLKIVLAIMCLVFFSAFPAAPHTHTDADGTTVDWYPVECCHNKDCRPVASIQPAYNGLWMTTVDGFTVLIGPNQSRRRSHDMRWHICIGKDDMDPTSKESIVCVFEPPQS